MGDKMEVCTKNVANEDLYGLTLRNVLDAAEICGDTSVLEKLFPWAFKTEKGKELLDQKKIEAGEKREGKTEADHAGIKGEEEFVLKMNRREAEVLRCITGNIAGGGNCLEDTPRRVSDKIYSALVNKGARKKYYISAKNSMKLPDSWEKFEALK